MDETLCIKGVLSGNGYFGSHSETTKRNFNYAPSRTGRCPRVRSSMSILYVYKVHQVGERTVLESSPSGTGSGFSSLFRSYPVNKNLTRTTFPDFYLSFLTKKILLGSPEKRITSWNHSEVSFLRPRSLICPNVFVRLL